MATSTRRQKSSCAEKISDLSVQDDSSESEGEPEPAKAFHRRISTNKEIKTSKSIKESYLMKQTSSFQRWRRRFFKLKGRKLYYAKDTKSVMYDEIELIHCSIAECSVKNVNHSFQVITPFRNLVLCSDSRKEMEEWIVALRSAANREFYEPNPDHREYLSGHHNWYACSHARPTYCNVCREALSGVTSHGLSCEVCKFKVHKRCATRASNDCKWTTLASIGKAIIEEEDRTISMPHQWLEGNLPVSAKCSVCEKTCGSVLRLQDWRCLWCKCMVHTSCRDSHPKKCPLGQCRITILPPIAISNLDSDGFWRATKPPGTSPLLVFVNSKSGDNQGVKMLRKFKQILNPAQVFDLMNGGPKIGLRLFQNFDAFRVLVCGGDGSIGWVLNEIDKLGLHKMEYFDSKKLGLLKQCQVGVLPMGTGNDLARVLGWGSAFDDDTQLSPVLEKLEHAQIKMLDRWSVLTYEYHSLPPRRDQISAYEESVADHLSHILNSDNHGVVINSAKVLCETVKEFVAKVGQSAKDHEVGEDSLSRKCGVLNEKLDALLSALEEESKASSSAQTTPEENIPPLPLDSGAGDSPDRQAEEGSPKEMLRSKENEKDIMESEEAVIGSPPDHDTVPDKILKPMKSKTTLFKPRDQLMLRANSLKKAIRQVIEQTEKAVDEQNAQTQKHEQIAAALVPPTLDNSRPSTPTPESLPHPPRPDMATDLSFESNQPDRKISESFLVPPIISPDEMSLGSPLEIETKFPFNESEYKRPPECIPIPMLSLPRPIPGSPTTLRHGFGDHMSPTSPVCPIPDFSAMEIHITGPDDEGIEVTEADTLLGAMSPPISSMACLSVPHFAFSDGDSSTCTTPGSLSPMPGNSPLMERKDFSPPLTPLDPHSPQLPRNLSSRRISSMSTCNKFGLLLGRDKSPTKEVPPLTFPLLGPTLPKPSSPAISSSLAGGMTGKSFISKVLLANADALCAAATPLMTEDVDISDYQEKCVMNNYFGIGLDAKITLDFHNKREEHPEKCRSRTKNLMWYGVIGSKEMVHRTFKNLEQRVTLECDGQRIPLPNLQGIVVLNITSYMGGTNFWGSTKGDNFTTPSFDDKILEVVAVFGSVQLGISRVLNLQRHRIAQCRSVKITIMGEEGVPVQVDGEAWVQPPGYIRITHKNRAQMLTRDKVFEEALKTWTEKQKIEREIGLRHHILSDEETTILHSFVEATEMLIKSVKVASICHSNVEQELFHLASQASGFLDRLYPSGKLAEPAIRTQVSDLVSSVRTLYNETKLFLAEKMSSLNMRPEVEAKLHESLTAMDIEMRKVYEIGGLPHFQAIEQEATELHRKRKEKTRFRLMSRLMRGGRKDKSKDHEYTGPSVRVIQDWGTEEVGQWLDCLGLGEYKEKFIANDVRGPELLHLGRTDLKEMGVSKVGHLKRIQHGIKEIKEKLYHMHPHHH